MNPLVSIILPTYNGARFITRAIESVLNQTYANWELLIISDGSTDRTKGTVEGFAKNDSRIIFIENEENRGIQKTLNKGIAMAKGEYIARLDDDDEWVDPLKLSAQIGFFQKNPDHVLAGTDAIVVDEKGDTLSVNIMPKSDHDIRSRILSRNCFLHSTIVARKSVLEKAGGYDETKETLHAEDYDLWLRVGLEGKMANLEMKSAKLTAHGNSLTSRNRVMQARHILGVMRKNRKKYPHFLAGYVTAMTRLIFFQIIAILPFPKSAWYAIQRIYRSV